MRHFEKICFALAMLVIFAPYPAAAQDITPLDVSNFFTTETGDPFTSVFLHQIFGPVFPSASGVPTTTVFSQIIGYFNTIILVVGGMMFFWNATVGLMQSAHEGKVLGSRWSSLWAPVRILFAVGLLVPLPGIGGYNLAQAGVAYIVKGSTNIASAVWSTSAEMVITGRTPITVPEPGIDPQVVRTLYMNVACLIVINDQMNIAAGSSLEPFVANIRQIPNPTDGSTVLQTYLTRSGRVYHENICGSYSTPPIPDYLTRDQDRRVVIEGIPATEQDRLMDVWSAMHLSAANNMNSQLISLVTSVLPDMKNSGRDIPDISGGITEAVLSTKQDLSDGAQEIIEIVTDGEGWGNSRTALLRRIQGTSGGSCARAAEEGAINLCYGEGWIGAGSWYMMMAQINNEMTSLFTASPSATRGTYVDNPNVLQRALGIREPESVSSFVGTEAFTGSSNTPDETGIQTTLNRYAIAFDQSVDGLAALGFPMSQRGLADTSRPSNASETLNQMDGLNSWAEEFRNFTVGWMSPSNSSRWGEDPMIALATMGQYLIDGAGILVAGSAIAGLAAGAQIATLLTPFIITLLTAGSILAFLLPILPFIFWVLAVTGYFILVVEAMIAVNLWALSHLRLDGEGLSGESGRQGWLMLLSLLMTPVLMIFGFLIGMTIFRVSTTIIDMGIYQALSGILGSGIWVNLVATAAFSIFMAIFYMILVERSFSLVSEFPGRVLRLMGASAELTRGEEGKARMAAAGAGVAVARGAGAGNQLAGRGLSQIGVGRNGQSNPEGFGAGRRALEQADTTPSEGDGFVTSARKSIGRAMQRGLGIGPRSIGRGGPPKSGG
jgi:conjugal transfer/type IV secretion protein DotA/TraY